MTNSIKLYYYVRKSKLLNSREALWFTGSLEATKYLSEQINNEPLPLSSTYTETHQAQFHLRVFAWAVPCTWNSQISTGQPPHFLYTFVEISPSKYGLP